MTNVKSIAIGDKFWYFSAVDGVPRKGVVVALSSHPGKRIGLELENFTTGHDCDGHGTPGKCWYVIPNDILTDAEYKAKQEADKAVAALNNVEFVESIEL
jgi:hypothetical protein